MSTTVREEYEVGDLDPTGVLEAAAEAERIEREAALRKLELGYQWAVLHPATADTARASRVRAFMPSPGRRRARAAAASGAAGCRGGAAG